MKGLALKFLLLAAPFVILIGVELFVLRSIFLRSGRGRRWSPSISVRLTASSIPTCT
jgi:hypothetical protein